jgi:hypothetical protein
MRQTKTKVTITIEGIDPYMKFWFSYLEQNISEGVRNGSVTSDAESVPVDVKWKTTTEEIEI